MKKIFLFLTLLAISFSAQIALSQTKFNVYNNARFGYSISYPSNLVPKGESTNGDGQVIEAKDKSAKLTVWGANNALEQSMTEIYNGDLKRYGQAVTYKTIGGNFYVISGKRNGKIFYQKTVKGASGDQYFTFVFEYTETKRATYDKTAAQIAKSFK